MFERRYRVLDDSKRELATGMTLEMAIVFVKGYIHEFYNEHAYLIIDELEEACAENKIQEAPCIDNCVDNSFYM